jgi:putative endonuclease
MTTLQKTIGNRAEAEALKFLTQKGLRLVEKNFQCLMGEIDLIMEDKEHIVFIEVRSRSRSTHGNAAESITPAKIRKIIKTATLYLQMKKWLYKVNSRFDVLAIDFTEQERQVTWLKNAFTAE